MLKNMPAGLAAGLRQGCAAAMFAPKAAGSANAPTLREWRRAALFEKLAWRDMVKSRGKMRGGAR